MVLEPRRITPESIGFAISSIENESSSFDRLSNTSKTRLISPTFSEVIFFIPSFKTPYLRCLSPSIYLLHPLSYL
ncbi:MAG: hypothetical protein AB1630_12210, partial [bacterium]